MLSIVLLHVKRIPYFEFSNIQINAVHALQPNSLRSVLTLHSHLRLAFQVVSFPYNPQPKAYMYFSSPPYVPHSLPISRFSI